MLLTGKNINFKFQAKLHERRNKTVTDVQCIKTRKADIKTLSACIYVPAVLIIRGYQNGHPPFLVYQLASRGELF